MTTIDNNLIMVKGKIVKLSEDQSKKLDKELNLILTDKRDCERYKLPYDGSWTSEQISDAKARLYKELFAN